MLIKLIGMQLVILGNAPPEKKYRKNDEKIQRTCL